MEALGQPGQQAWLGIGQVHAGHANLRESKFLGPRLQATPQVHTIDQHPCPLNNPWMVHTEQWPDEAATVASAQRMAARLLRLPVAGDAIVHLHGELGSGKTTWVRHLLSALGVTGRIKSPTYAVVEPHSAPHQSGELAIWHFDFYRFTDPQEWEDAGFRDVFASVGLKLCEWPGNAGPALPAPDVSLHLQWVDDNARSVRWQAHHAHGKALLP